MSWNHLRRNGVTYGFTMICLGMAFLFPCWGTWSPWFWGLLLEIKQKLSVIISSYITSATFSFFSPSGNLIKYMLDLYSLYVPYPVLFIFSFLLISPCFFLDISFDFPVYPAVSNLLLKLPINLSISITRNVFFFFLCILFIYLFFNIFIGV